MKYLSTILSTFFNIKSSSYDISLVCNISYGGYGGGQKGKDGSNWNGNSCKVNGKGGTQTSGGKGAENGCGSSKTYSSGAGSLGNGGNGNSESYSGGGGGGGYYGGGGSYEAGGGGGSSYASSDFFYSRLLYGNSLESIQTGNGKAIITTYTKYEPSCTCENSIPFYTTLTTFLLAIFDYESQ